MAEKEPNSDNNQNNGCGDNNLRQQTFLPKWSFVIITTVFIITLLVLGVAVILVPHKFQNETARFIVIVLLSYTFALVFYACLPQKAKIKKIPLIDLEVELIGPASLFIISFLFLSHFYPLPSVGRFYILNHAGEKIHMQLETLNVKEIDGQCSFYPANNGEEWRYLEGIYVKFPSGCNECVAEIKTSLDTYSATFERSKKTNIVELIPN